MTNLRILEHLKDLMLTIYSVSKTFPKDEEYNLKTQIRRAIVSVRLNIREGNSYTNNKKQQFFLIARGSLVETDECMIIATELEYIDSTTYNLYLEKYKYALNMLNRLIESSNRRT